jgi:hypothetical protein
MTAQVWFRGHRLGAVLAGCALRCGPGCDLRARVGADGCPTGHGRRRTLRTPGRPSPRSRGALALLFGVMPWLRSGWYWRTRTGYRAQSSRNCPTAYGVGEPFERWRRNHHWSMLSVITPPFSARVTGTTDIHRASVDPDRRKAGSPRHRLFEIGSQRQQHAFAAPCGHQLHTDG